MDLIEYHEAGPKDLEIVLALRKQFSDELVGKQDPVLEEKLVNSLRDYFLKELSKNYLCWYATVNGEVASIAGMTIRIQPGNVRNPSGVWGYIMSVYTLPQYRRKGLSANVLRRLMQSAREKGVRAFELHATAEGEAVYVKEGFVKHKEPTYRLIF